MSYWMTRTTKTKELGEWVNEWIETRTEGHHEWVNELLERLKLKDSMNE